MTRGPAAGVDRTISRGKCIRPSPSGHFGTGGRASWRAAIGGPVCPRRRLDRSLALPRLRRFSLLPPDGVPVLDVRLEDGGVLGDAGLGLLLGLHLANL